FQLGVMDLELTLVMDVRPLAITEAWEQSNRQSSKLMRLTMATNVKPYMPKTNYAREFMKMVKEYLQSVITSKLIVRNLSSELTNRRFDWSQPIHDHVTEMSNLVAKLKSTGMEVNYNTLKEKWNFQEIKAMLIQEKGRLKKVKDISIHLMTHDGAITSKSKLGKKDMGKAQLKVNEGGVYKEKKCYFCKQSGHFKKDCPKRKKWFETKVPNSTFGATTYGFLSIQTIRIVEKFLYMGNKMKAGMEGNGTYRLILDI
ncbi:hypothetical protein CR513_49864, partial [Mucuna pruriens]